MNATTCFLIWDEDISVSFCVYAFEKGTILSPLQVKQY